MAPSPQAIKEADSFLEKLSRRIWCLPTSFPKAGLHVPIEDIGLNIPSAWEEFCGSALRSWAHILNDEEDLGITARASYTERILNFGTDFQN